MNVLVLCAGLVCLMLLMLRWKVYPFLALIAVSILLGLAFGMGSAQLLLSLQKGIASTLSGILLLLSFGAMFGNILSASGAADKISEGLILRFGQSHVQWAMVTTAFLIGLPMFYTAGFVILLPIVFSVASKTEKPLLYVAIPTAAALSVTHGFLPPHPGPSAIAVMYKADLGLTMLFGLIIAIPTVIVAGPVWGKMVVRFSSIKSMALVSPEKELLSEPVVQPSFGTSVFTVLFPIFLISLAAFAKLIFSGQAHIFFVPVLLFIGDPSMALLLGVVVSMVVLRKHLPPGPAALTKLLSQSIESVAGILLIIAAGGALKEILVESGVGNEISSSFLNLHLSPLFVGWALAAILRIALGSATVAALASAGIVLPFITPGTSRELMVLATGAGSLMFSHVNDAGFWIFKEYFKLTIPQTLLSWSLMETIVSLMGLIGVLVLDCFV